MTCDCSQFISCKQVIRVTFSCIECCLKYSHLRYTHTYKITHIPSFVPFVVLFKLSTEKKIITNNRIHALYRLI